MAKIYIGKDGRVMCYSEVCSCIEDCKRINECQEVRSFIDVLDDIAKLRQFIDDYEIPSPTCPEDPNKCLKHTEIEMDILTEKLMLMIDEILDKET